MSTFFSLTVVAILLSQPSPDHAPERVPIQVQKTYIERSRISEFLPKGPIHVRDMREFEEKLARYRQRRPGATSMLPVACRLQATFDPVGSRLAGTGSFETADPEAELQLSPWNLVMEPETQGIRYWGTDRDGDIRVLLAEGNREFKFRWEIGAITQSSQRAFEIRVPNCAVSYLDLELPAGWVVRTFSQTIYPDQNRSKPRIFFGGSPAGLAIDIVPADDGNNEKSVLTWRSYQTIRFDENGTEVEADVRLESLHQSATKVGFLLDSAFQPEKVSVPVQRWDRQEAGFGLVRWSAEFRHPPLGQFEVVFRAQLPASSGVFFHPLTVVVEHGLPRGETIDLSIGHSLRIAETDAGSLHKSFLGDDLDGRYHLVLKGPGDSRWDPAAMLFSRSTTDDYPSFFRKLTQAAAVGEEGPASRLLRKLTPDSKRLLAPAVDTGTLDDATLDKLLAEINELLWSADLFEPASIPTQGPAGEARRLLARKGDGLSLTQIVRANRLTLDHFLPASTPSAVAPNKPPTVRLMTGQPHVDVSLTSFLRLQREDVRLLSRVTWRCQQGTLYQPQLFVPKGWEVTTVQQVPSGWSKSLPEPESKKKIPYRLEPFEEGSSLLWLELDDWLTAPENLYVEIESRLQESMPSTLQGPAPLNLPEIRPGGDFPFSRPSVYTLSVDADVPCSLDNLPPAIADPAEIPAAMFEEDGERHTFEYESPLRTESLQMLPRPPRYSATHQQRWEWDGSAWHVEWRFDVSMQQGAVDFFDFSTTRALPADMQWTLDAANNKARTIELETPSDERPFYRYRVQLEVPVRKSTVLSAIWKVAGSQANVPLLNLENADSYRGEVQVLSQTGEVVAIDARQLSPSPPGEAEEVKPSVLLLYAGSYLQLHPEMYLGLDVAVSPPLAGGADFLGTAYLRSYCSLQNGRAVERVFAWLDCAVAEPLTIRVPGDSHLWNVTLDGETVQPWTGDGSFTLPGRLTPGLHALEMVFSHATFSRWGIRTVEFPIPLVDWHIGSLVHDIEQQGQSLLIADSRLRVISRIQYGEPDGSASLFAVPNRVSAVPTLRDALEKAYRDLAPQKRLELPAMLMEMQLALPRELVFAIDEPVVTRADSRVVRGNAAAATFEQWLAERGLQLLVGTDACVLSHRLIYEASENDSAQQGVDSWLTQLSRTLGEQGVDGTGRFTTPVRFAARFENATVHESSILNIQPSPAGQSELWTLSALDTRSLDKVSVTIVSRQWLVRVSVLVAGMLLVPLWFYAAKIPARWQRIAVVLLLGTLLGCTFAGEIYGRILAIPIWMAVSGLLCLMLLDSRKSLNAAVVSSLVWAAFMPRPMAAQEPELSSTTTREKKFRVIVPYDLPTDEKSAEKVMVPQELWSLLENVRTGATNTRFLLQQASYSGKLQSDEQVRWQAKLIGLADEQTELPTTISLPLNHISVDSIRVNGTAVERFRPSGESSDLELESKATGNLTIEIDFRTPVLGNASEKELQFTIPPCVNNGFTLDMGPGPVTLPSNLPIAATMETTLMGTVVSGNLGYSDTFSLRWRTATLQQDKPPTFGVNSAHLLEVREEGGDLQSAFRIQVSDGELSAIDFSISPDLVVRRVDTEIPLSWEIVRGPDRSRFLRVPFPTPRSGAIDIRVQSMVRGNLQSAFDYPTVHPMGAAVEEGMLGIIASPTWKIDEIKFRNAEVATPADFKTWSEKLGVKLQAPLVFAKRFRQRPLELTVQTQPSSPAWDVRQDIIVVPNPLAGTANIKVDVELRRGPAEPSMLQFHVPEGFELQRVDGNNLYQWYQQGSFVVLLPKGTRSEDSFTLEGRWRGTAQRGNGLAPMSFDFTGIEWLQTQSTATSWSIERSDKWTFEARNIVNATQEPTADTNPLRFSSMQERHSFRLILQPIHPVTKARQLIVATLAEDKIVFTGIFELASETTGRRRVQFVTPKQMQSIEWLSAMESSPVSVPRGTSKQWTLEPRIEAGQPTLIKWRMSLPIRTSVPVDVPRPRLLGISDVESVVAVAGGPDLLSNVARELESMEPGDELAQWAIDQSTGVSPGDARFYRAKDSNWQLQLNKRSKAVAAHVTRMRHAQADAVTADDGSIVGVSHWQVHNESGGVVVVDLPADCQVRELRLDGHRIVFPRIVDASVRFPIQAATTWQSVVMNWTILPKPNPRKVGLPKLRLPGDQELLVRFRLGDGNSVLPQGALIRGQWLLKRLGFEVVQIGEALQRRHQSKENPYLQALVMTHLDHWRSLSIELEEYLHLFSTNDVESDQSLAALLKDYSTTRQQFESVISRFSVQSLVDESTRRPVVATNPELPLDWAVSSDSSYWQVPIDVEFELTNASRWWDSAFEGLDWLGMLTAVFGILVLTVPLLERIVTAYWAVFVLPIGVMWFRWSQSPILGTLAFALCVAFLAWTVRRWFSVTHSLFDLEGTTILKPDSSVSGSVTAIAENGKEN